MFGVGKVNLSVLHLYAKMPSLSVRPEILKLSLCRLALLPLSRIEPPNGRFSGRLTWYDRAPLIRTRQLALTSVACGEGWLHQGGVNANILEQVRRCWERGEVANWLEAGLKKRRFACVGLRHIIAGIMGEDLDVRRAVGIVLEVEFGKMLRDIPVWRELASLAEAER